MQEKAHLLTTRHKDAIINATSLIRYNTMFNGDKMKTQETTKEENPMDFAENDITHSNDADSSEGACKEASSSSDESGSTADKESKKKRIIKVAIILVASIVISFLLGYGIITLIFTGGGKAKEFKAAEMSITLTEGFTQQYVPTFDAVYVSNSVDVTVNKDSYANGGYSGFNATQYARYIMQQNGYTDSEVKTENGLNYFVYETTDADGNKYICHAYAYKESEAYWLVQFTVKESKAEKYAEDIAEWAKSVKFE